MNRPQKAFGVYERPEASGRSRWLWAAAIVLAVLAAVVMLFLSR
jgi:hypothetical protein